MQKHVFASALIIIAATGSGLIPNRATGAPGKCAALFESRDRVAPSIGFASENLIRYEASVANQILERGYIIDPFLVALIAKEHILMVGPPGNAKTTLAKTLLQNIVDAQTGKSDFYSIQMNKEITLSDTHGGLNFGLLKDGVVQRKYEDGALGAKLGFFDETFDVRPGALRNSLDILAERAHSQGTKQHYGKTQMIIAATNKTLPEVYADFNNSEGPRALIDRFAFVFYVPKEMMSIKSDRMIFSNKRASSEPIHQLTFQDLDSIRSLLPKVDVPDYIADLALMMHHRLGPEFESREVKSMELYREQIANGEPALPPYRAAKYLSPRTLAKAGGILKSIVVLDYIRKNGARELTATPDDLERLRLFYQVNGPAEDALNAQLSRAAKEHEKDQITIVQSERKIVDPLFEAVIRDFKSALARREIPPFSAMASRYKRLSLSDRRRLADLMKSTYLELRAESEKWRSKPEDADQKDISYEDVSAGALVASIQADARKIWGDQASQVIANWERDFTPSGKIKPRVQRKSDYRYRDYDKEKPKPIAANVKSLPTAAEQADPAALAKKKLNLRHLSGPVRKIDSVLKHSFVPSMDVNSSSFIALNQPDAVLIHSAVGNRMLQGNLPSPKLIPSWDSWKFGAAFGESEALVNQDLSGVFYITKSDGFGEPVGGMAKAQIQNLKTDLDGSIIVFESESIKRLNADHTYETLVSGLFTNAKLGSTIPGAPEQFAVITETGGKYRLLITEGDRIRLEISFSGDATDRLIPALKQAGARLSMIDATRGIVSGKSADIFAFEISGSAATQEIIWGQWGWDHNEAIRYGISSDARIIALRSGDEIDFYSASDFVGSLRNKTKIEVLGSLKASVVPDSVEFSPDGKSLFAISANLIEQFELKSADTSAPKLVQPLRPITTPLKISNLQIVKKHEVTSPEDLNPHSALLLGVEGTYAIRSATGLRVLRGTMAGFSEPQGSLTADWTQATTLGSNTLLLPEPVDGKFYLVDVRGTGIVENGQVPKNFRRDLDGSVVRFSEEGISRIHGERNTRPRTNANYPGLLMGSLIPNSPTAVAFLRDVGSMKIHLEINGLKTEYGFPEKHLPQLKALVGKKGAALFMVDSERGFITSEFGETYFFEIDPAMPIVRNAQIQAFLTRKFALSLDGRVAALYNPDFKKIFFYPAANFIDNNSGRNKDLKPIGAIEIATPPEVLKFSPDGKSLYSISKNLIEQLSVEVVKQDEPTPSTKPQTTSFQAEIPVGRYINTAATIPLGTPDSILAPENVGRAKLLFGPIASVKKSVDTWTSLNDAVALGASDAIVRDVGFNTWHVRMNGSGGTHNVSLHTHTMRRESNGDVTLFQNNDIKRVMVGSEVAVTLIANSEQSIAGSLVPERSNEFVVLTSDGEKQRLLYVDIKSKQPVYGIEFPESDGPLVKQMTSGQSPKLYMIDALRGFLSAESGNPYFFEIDANFKINGKIKHSKAGPKYANIAVSDDGKLIATSDFTAPPTMPSNIRLKSNIRLWDALKFVMTPFSNESSQPLEAIEAEIHAIKVLRFAPDGKSLFAISDEKVQQIRIDLSLPLAPTNREFDLRGPGASGGRALVALSHDGSRIGGQILRAPFISENFAHPTRSNPWGSDFEQIVPFGSNDFLVRLSGTVKSASAKLSGGTSFDLGGDPIVTLLREPDGDVKIVTTKKMFLLSTKVAEPLPLAHQFDIAVAASRTREPGLTAVLTYHSNVFTMLLAPQIAGVTGRDFAQPAQKLLSTVDLENSNLHYFSTAGSALALRDGRVLLFSENGDQADFAPRRASKKTCTATDVSLDRRLLAVATLEDGTVRLYNPATYLKLGLQSIEPAFLAEFKIPGERVDSIQISDDNTKIIIATAEKVREFEIPQDKVNR